MSAARVDDNEPEASDAESLPSRWLRLAWTLTGRVMLWLKAVGSVLLLAGGTLTDQYQLVDIQGFLKNIFGDSVKLPAIIGGVTVAYLLLTLLLKLPKGFSNNAKQNDGE